jgi:hypothetical protein
VIEQKYALEGRVKSQRAELSAQQFTLQQLGILRFAVIQSKSPQSKNWIDRL